MSWRPFWLSIVSWLTGTPTAICDSVGCVTTLTRPLWPSYDPLNSSHVPHKCASSCDWLQTQWRNHYDLVNSAMSVWAVRMLSELVETRLNVVESITSMRGWWVGLWENGLENNNQPPVNVCYPAIAEKLMFISGDYWQFGSCNFRRSPVASCIFPRNSRENCRWVKHWYTIFTSI